MSHSHFLKNQHTADVNPGQKQTCRKDSHKNSCVFLFVFLPCFRTDSENKRQTWNPDSEGPSCLVGTLVLTRFSVASLTDLSRWILDTDPLCSEMAFLRMEELEGCSQTAGCGRWVLLGRGWPWRQLPLPPEIWAPCGTVSERRPSLTLNLSMGGFTRTSIETLLVFANLYLWRPQNYFSNSTAKLQETAHRIIHFIKS